MHLSKSHKVAAVIIIIAAFLVLENTLLRPASVSRYNGIQIYDAIRDFRDLESRGFDVVVHVEGTSGNKPVKLSGQMAETYAGWFVMSDAGKEGINRIVEGPMGSKDVLASLIYFDISPTISVEAVFEPEKAQKLDLKEGFRRVKGSLSFDDATISPTMLQELRNLNGEFYALTPNRIEVIPFGSGFIMDIRVPVPVADLNGLVSRIGAGNVQTGYMYYYTEADDENDIPALRKDLEGKGAVIVNYHKQR